MHRLAAGVLLASIALALGSQLLRPAVPPARSAPPVAEPALEVGSAGLDAPTPDRPALARIRADVAFWSGRARAHPTDFVSAAEWAAAEIELARATGDLAAWARAESAATTALAVHPGHRAAAGARGAALLALHRFADARDLARRVLADRPDDPSGLALLGDASLDLGEYAEARDAYARLDSLGRTAASATRLARLVWLEGRTADALELADSATALATLEGASGERLAWYRLQEFELLVATGDPEGARLAAAAALEADPGSAAARVALARIDAAAGRLDDAIARLDEAIAIVPRPESLARRADLLALRRAPGDEARAARDHATIEAIAGLAGDRVSDRSHALYLADHGLLPDRAVSIAQAELATRRDVHGHDALAWALLAAGQTAEADAEMARALALGTREPRLLYHAGMIAAALGEADRARTLLGDAIALDAAFEPLQLARARETLAALGARP
jgi:tetratricopeptide (TPR) repeat protein